jgi:hypothetical protein
MVRYSRRRPFRFRRRSRSRFYRRRAYYRRARRFTRPRRRYSRRYSSKFFTRIPKQSKAVAFKKLQYSDTDWPLHGTFDGINTYYHHVFRGNSINDPDVTGVGTQPYGHDEWAGLYNNYAVMSSSITILLNIYCTSGSQLGKGFTAFLYPDDQTAAPTYVERADLAQVPMVKVYHLDAMGANGRHHFKLKHYKSTRKMFYNRATNTNPSNMYNATAFNANPTNQWYWHVIVFQNDGPVDISTSLTMEMDAKVNYYTKLTERKALDES